MNPQVLHCVVCKPDKREEGVAFSMMRFQCVSKLNFTLLGSHFKYIYTSLRQGCVFLTLKVCMKIHLLTFYHLPKMSLLCSEFCEAQLR